MRLTSVRARNFKSFGELDIQLENLNIAIGANASGKSNLVQLFAFVRDVVESGLDNAISIQGGPQYLRNVKCEGIDTVAIELSIEPDPGDPVVPFPQDSGDSRVIRCKYRFALSFPGGRNISIAEDELTVERCGNGPLSHSSSFTIRRVGDQYQMDGVDVFGSFLMSQIVEPRHPMLLVEHETLRSMLPLSGLKSIGTYDIDSKGPKKAAFAGKSELEQDANNLAIVIEKILSDDQNRRKLLNLLKDVLPFADSVDTEPLLDSSLFFTMRERFSHLPMPASFLSDGTIDIIALIVILYFERKPLVLIEEPERKLHPSLMSKLAEMFSDASRNKQIIVSTHSAEIVRHVDAARLILVSRDESGFSHASRPVDKAHVQQFLRDEISMDELFVQNLLEA